MDSLRRVLRAIFSPSSQEEKDRGKLYRGVIINVVFAAIKIYNGIATGSVWLIAVAIYNLSVITAKVVLVRYDLDLLRGGVDDPLRREWTAYLRTGQLMLGLDAALTGIVYLTVWRGGSWSYRGNFIFAMALFAFYKIGKAILEVTRNRNRRGPLYAAAKALDLSAAVVAMFSLQTAMLLTFSGEAGDSARFVAILNSATGIAVLLIVLGIALFMILRGRKNLEP